MQPKGPSASCRRRITRDGRAAIRYVTGRAASASTRRSRPSGHVPEVIVFEPLGESASERSTGNHKMMVIVWVVVGVVTLALIAVSLM